MSFIIFYKVLYSNNPSKYSLYYTTLTLPMNKSILITNKFTINYKTVQLFYRFFLDDFYDVYHAETGSRTLQYNHNRDLQSHTHTHIHFLY